MKKTITFLSRRAAMMLLATMLLTLTAQTAWAGDVLYAEISNYGKNMTLKCASSFPGGENRYQYDGNYSWTLSFNNNTYQVTDVTIDQSCQNYTGTTLSYLFYNLNKATIIRNLSYLRTDDVTDMNHMFYSCSVVTSLDLSGFNTAKVTNMNDMFMGCKAVNSLNLSGFNTASVTNMNGMFISCQSLTTLNLTGWNTASVTDMSDMFNCCNNLTTLDLTDFNTANVTTMDGMFFDCNHLTTIRVGLDWSTASVTEANNDMFKDCNNLVGGASTTYNSSNTGKAYAHVDGGNGNPGYLTYGDWAGTGEDANHPYILGTCAELNRLPRRVNSGNSYASKFFKLGGDITYNGTNNFTPIGTESHSFGATFDGDGNTISGLDINLSTTDYVGLFGYANGATIKNVGLANSTIAGKDRVGGITGFAGNTKVINCGVASDVSISGDHYVGGVSGMSGKITGCTSAADVSATWYVGGIVGFINGKASESIDHCLYTGSSVTGKNNGAIVGFNFNSASMTANYYTVATIGGLGNYGEDSDGVRKAVAIGAAADVTITPVGTATNYDISNITAYANNSGISYGGNLYAGETEEVNLTINYSGNVPEGYKLNGYTDGNGNALTKNGNDTYTLTVGTTDVTVTATITESTAKTDIATCQVTMPDQALYDGVYEYSYIGYKFSMHPETIGEEVKDGGNTLTRGTDYSFDSVTFASDGEPCTERTNQIGDVFNVEIRGEGNYTGTKTVSFTLVGPKGTWGNLKWSLANDGTLNITGTGTMNDTENYNGYGFPWINCRDDITAIVIGEGITSIANKAFGAHTGEELYSNVDDIDLPSSLTTIGSNAFDGCKKDGLNIDIPPTVTSVGPDAFTGVASVSARLSDAVEDNTTFISALSGAQTADVSFSRTFNAGKASTVCLPFEVSPAAAAGKFYTFVGVGYTEQTGWVATMQEPNATTLTANTPYLFKPSGESGTIDVNFSGPLTNLASVLPGETVANTAEGTWTFKGTYKKLTYAAVESNENPFSGKVFGFAASDGANGVVAGEFVRADTGASIRAFRAFLKYAGDETSLQARGTRGGETDIPETITVRLIDKTGEIDGIGEIRLSTGEVTFDSNAWYDLNGRKLTEKPTQKGIYINNGHKIAIK